MPAAQAEQNKSGASDQRDACSDKNGCGTLTFAASVVLSTKNSIGALSNAANATNLPPAAGAIFIAGTHSARSAPATRGLGSARITRMVRMTVIFDTPDAQLPVLYPRLIDKHLPIAAGQSVARA